MSKYGAESHLHQNWGKMNYDSSDKSQRGGNSLGVQWLGLHAFTARGRVQSLVGELRSHKLCSGAKKKKASVVCQHSIYNSVNQDSKGRSAHF